MEKKKTSNPLMMVMITYICTLFIYKDFGVRMYLGYLFLLFPLMFYVLSYKKINIDKIAYAYFLIIFAILFSFLRHTARFDKDNMAYVISMLICFGYALLMKPSVKQFEKLEKTIYIFSFSFAVIVIVSRVARELYLSTIFQLLTIDAQEASYDSIWHGYSCTIAGDNTFHNYIFMVATMCSLGHIAESRKNWKNYYIQTLIFIMASFLTGRRGEFIALLLTWIFLGLFIMPKNQRKKVFKAGIIIGLCTLPFLPKFFNSSLVSRYITTILAFKSGNDFLSGRIELWNEAIRLFKEHPILGIGWGGYAYFVSESYRSIHGNVYNVHNIYLQFLAETGIVGTTMILLGLFLIYLHTLKQSFLLKNIEKDCFLRKLNLFSLGVQSYFFIVGLIDPCFMKYYFWCFYTIAFAMIQYIDQALRNQNSMKYFLKRI